MTKRMHDDRRLAFGAKEGGRLFTLLVTHKSQSLRCDQEHGFHVWAETAVSGNGLCACGTRHYQTMVAYTQ